LSWALLWGRPGLARWPRASRWHSPFAGYGSFAVSVGPKRSMALRLSGKRPGTLRKARASTDLSTADAPTPANRRQHHDLRRRARMTPEQLSCGAGLAFAPKPYRRRRTELSRAATTESRARTAPGHTESRSRKYADPP